MTRTRRIVAAAVLALVAGLAGCAAPGTGSADQEAAAAAALEKFESSNAAGNEAESVNVHEWRDGYAVLLRVTGTGGNPPKPFENFEAYGVVPGGDAWAVDNWNLVDKQLDPAKNPARAACLTLAEDQTEQDACAAIEG